MGEMGKKRKDSFKIIFSFSLFPLSPFLLNLFHLFYTSFAPRTFSMCFNANMWLSVSNDETQLTGTSTL